MPAWLLVGRFGHAQGVSVAVMVWFSMNMKGEGTFTWVVPIADLSRFGTESSRHGDIDGAHAHIQY